jgi:6-phosphogluconate dehydrogenase
MQMGTETGAQLGIIGLAVMGRNLALNVLDHGYTVIGYNRSPEPLALAVEQSGGRLAGAGSLAQLVASLSKPRKIMLMIKAGDPVDTVMGQLEPLLQPGDIVVDGGNSWYLDTRRREKRYAESGLHFFGVGVSGGEEGARFGPSIMPGGDREAYESIRPIFEAIAAQTESGPCVTYVGPDGAGHFVKMVHNGIEYADMQFIAEVYDLLRRLGGLRPDALAEIFAQWNRGPLESFLIELTAKILNVRDPRTEDFLVNQVLDRAGQKGTGRWTVQAALDLGVSVPCIAAAVDARLLSSLKEQRRVASGILQGPEVPQLEGDVDSLIEATHDALYAAKIVDYAQGMDLIATASQEYGWSIDLSEIARIWKGGCIIRARLLDAIMQAYSRRPDLPNLLLDEQLSRTMHSLQQRWREVTGLAQRYGVPVGGLASSVTYFDSYRTESLPQNLTQAQRDAFGAHTYQRIDDPEGAFVHTDWLG